MKYKILLRYDTDKTDYYKFYQDTNTNQDWESTDKEQTESTILELLETYNLSDLKVVIGIDVGINIALPDLPDATTE